MSASDRIIVPVSMKAGDQMAASQPQSTHAPEAVRVVSNRVARAIYLVLGFVTLGLGIAGYIVPLLPGTVFLLMSSYFFFRSSERMYNWVMNHPRFGDLIRNYKAGYGIPRRIKVYAIALIVVSFSISVFVVASGVMLRTALIACAVAISTFILTRPTTEVVLEAR
jgi:uncharacterized membrane protein YbaN (DUF454 family)